MDRVLMPYLLLSQHSYGYYPEYVNLTEEEKKYMDFVNKCLNETNDKFSDACTRSMLFILEITSKMGTCEELTNEELAVKKEQLLSDFGLEDRQKLESFMYACIQTMGIYSEERIQERKEQRGKDLTKKLNPFELSLSQTPNGSTIISNGTSSHQL